MRHGPFCRFNASEMFRAMSLDHISRKGMPEDYYRPFFGVKKKTIKDLRKTSRNTVQFIGEWLSN
jgi:hypothetical protein